MRVTSFQEEDTLTQWMINWIGQRMYNASSGTVYHFYDHFCGVPNARRCKLAISLFYSFTNDPLPLFQSAHILI